MISEILLNNNINRYLVMFRCVITYIWVVGDLGRVRSNASHYATPFSPRAYESKYIHFNMDNDEDIRRIAADISEGNRYYCINYV